MNLSALQDNIVLRPIMAGNVTAGGIVLPNQGKFEDGAVIISVGPDVERLVVGDIVVRPDPPRIEVSDDDTGEIFLICAEVDVLAKMLPDEPNVLEVNDAPKETDKTEESEGDKEQEVAKDSEEGEVHTNRIPETRLDYLLPIHPVEGLHKDDGDEGVG